MKTINFISSIILFTLLQFNVAHAQNEKSHKVGVVNSALFWDEKEGLVVLRNANKQLEAEFKSSKDELMAMQSKITNYTAELKKLSGEALTKKQEEAERLNRDYQFKYQQLDQQYQKRYAQVMNPLTAEAGKALAQYAKQKGYSLLLDLAKNQDGLILWIEESEDLALTRDFIKFYNAK